MAKERCLVLGGAGFMGSHLVELLVQQQVPVRVFDLPGRAARVLSTVRNQIELVEGDFQREDDVRKAVEGCGVTFHLIGTTVPSSSNRDPMFDVETNVKSTLRLLEACRAAQVRRVIFSSSGGTVYGATEKVPIREDHSTEPLSSYGITKLTCEKYLTLFRHLHGLDYTVLRIGNAYGPRLPVTGEQGAVGVFLARLKRGEPIVVWGDGSTVRDYVYVKDVAKAFRSASREQSPFKIFNIGNGVGISLNQLIAQIEQVTGRKATIERKPARPADVPTNVLDASRAREWLGWRPSISLAEGLRHTWDWIQRAEV